MTNSKEKLQKLVNILIKEEYDDMFSQETFTIPVKKFNEGYEFFPKLGDKKIGYMHIEELFKEDFFPSPIDKTIKNAIGDFIIDNVYIENEYRNSGYGLKLYKFAIKFCSTKFAARVLPGDYFSRETDEYKDEKYRGKWGTTILANKVWNSLIRSKYINKNFFYMGK